MVRTVARYHDEKKLNEEKAKREQQKKLRRIAASIAREIEYFWSNIEQVTHSGCFANITKCVTSSFDVYFGSFEVQPDLDCVETERQFQQVVAAVGGVTEEREHSMAVSYED